MAGKNQYSKYLCHMSPSEKAAYNRSYYQRHKDYWKDYYSVGKTTGRPRGHQKDVVQGGTGVKRRSNGLGTGPVRPGKSGRSVDSSGSIDAWANLVEQTGSPLQSYAYNQAIGNPVPDEAPEMTYDDLVTYINTNFFDNALNAAKATKGKATAIGKAFVKNWKSGSLSISKLFKKGGR